ncbi:MAG: methylthioribulose 1-phosphate dehydratase [Gaiellaceae bacterium]
MTHVATELANLGRAFHGRGWVPATSGNFSAVVSRSPLRLAITASGLDKGALTSGDILVVDEEGVPVEGNGRPSNETGLHLAVVRACGAGAVLHTHSMWGTLASLRHASGGAVELEGYELLKALAGVGTHEHRERVPIVANDQDIGAMSRVVEDHLVRDPRLHAFLIEGHGLYTWGADLEAARRHVEALEFLFELSERAGEQATTQGADLHGDLARA